MPPSTPQKAHVRRISQLAGHAGTPGSPYVPASSVASSAASPATPPSRYVLAHDETPTRTNRHSRAFGESVSPSLTGSPDMSFGSLQHGNSSGSMAKGYTLGENDHEADDSEDQEVDHLSPGDAQTDEMEPEEDPDRTATTMNFGSKVDLRHNRTRETTAEPHLLGNEADSADASLADDGENDPPSGSSFGSYGSDSALEVLDNDEEEDEFPDEEDDLEGLDPGAPLTGRGRKRRRRRWEDTERRKDMGLLEIIPPLILAHPMPLLPLLALLPYNFLPAGVVFYIPIYCVLVALSAAGHIVIVYLAWYLKVSSFEEVFATVMGKYGQYGVWGGRVFVIISTMGMLVGWLGTFYPLLEPIAETYFPRNTFFSSRFMWTTFAAAFLLPSLLPSRMTRPLRRAPILLVLILPITVFLVIGRTVEIQKAASESPPLLGEASNIAGSVVKRGIGLSGRTAGAGLTTLTVFLTPHLNTLPIHSGLARKKRSSFPVSILIADSIILALSLPFALVPYYLLPSPANTEDATHITPTTSSGVFSQLPIEDGWVNVARLSMVALALGSCNMWIIRGRDTILKAMGVEHGERQKAGRWVGLAMWAIVVLFAGIGGVVADKIELVGVMATLAVGWLLPSAFFIVTFHVRSPLSIIFTDRNPPPATSELEHPASASHSMRSGRGHNHADSLSDPSTDILLARKEKQLQKRRLERRLWQDLIVYVGILPVGCLTIAWTLVHFLGIW